MFPKNIMTMNAIKYRIELINWLVIEVRLDTVKVWLPQLYRFVSTQLKYR